MRLGKNFIRNVWEFIWELILMVLGAAVGVIAIPIMLIYIICLSFYTRENPSEVIEAICVGINAAIEDIKD